jgi:hypothetical protein
MPVNPVSQMMAKARNNLTKEYPGSQITRQGTTLTIKETIEKDEYNTESTTEWVDPYVKLNPKTNRYRQVKGYYRQVEKPVSIMGVKGSLTQSSNKEIGDVLLS